MTGFAHDLGAQIILDETLAVLGRRRGVDPTCDIVQFGGMTPGTGKILPVRAHVHIELLVGLDKGGIQIPVFDPVSPATIEMADPAIGAGRATHRLGHLVPFRRIEHLLAELLGFRGGIAGTRRKFFVRSGLFVTDQTIHKGRISEIEILVLPAVPCVT